MYGHLVHFTYVWSFGTFYGHNLVYFTVIWHMYFRVFWYIFPRCGMLCQEKSRTPSHIGKAMKLWRMVTPSKLHNAAARPIGIANLRRKKS
jgi:hypothetical protein